METFVVTGANRGIGLELTRQLLSAQKRVVATCRNPDAAEALNALSGGDQLQIYPLELESADSIRQFCAEISDRTIDVLINNAGVLGGERQHRGSMDFDAWLQTLRINTIAPVQISMSLLENLKRSVRPRIIGISSQMGSLNRISSGSYAYRSSKAALNKALQTLAEDVKDDGIIVCPVHPGWVRTDMGGAQADIEVDESARGIMALAERLSMADSGKFFKWNGEQHAW